MIWWAWLLLAAWVPVAIGGAVILGRTVQLRERKEAPRLPEWEAGR